MTTEPEPTPVTAVAIVTGGGTGLGRAIVSSLLHAGMRCVIAGRRADRLLATQRDLEGLGEILTVPADITSPEDRHRIVAATIDRFGALDVLVNNAAGSHLATLLTYPEDAFDRVLASNVQAPFHLAQLALPHLRQRGRGRVVNIASVYGSVALNNAWYGPRLQTERSDVEGPMRESAYATSKGAIIQMTRELAVAVGPWGITVNSVSPGMFPVEDRPMPDELVQKLAAQTPLRRVGRPPEIGAAVAFLCSEDAAFITGVDLRVDGGWTIW